MFQGEDTDSTCASQKVLLNMPGTQPAASTVQGIPHREEVCDYIHHCCDTRGLE